MLSHWHVCMVCVSVQKDCFKQSENLIFMRLKLMRGDISCYSVENPDCWNRHQSRSHLSEYSTRKTFWGILKVSPSMRTWLCVTVHTHAHSILQKERAEKEGQHSRELHSSSHKFLTVSHVRLKSAGAWISHSREQDATKCKMMRSKAEKARCGHWNLIKS